jgi:hypothetical protein
VSDTPRETLVDPAHSPRPINYAAAIDDGAQPVKRHILGND